MNTQLSICVNLCVAGFFSQEGEENDGNIQKIDRGFTVRLILAQICLNLKENTKTARTILKTERNHLRFKFHFFLYQLWEKCDKNNAQCNGE